MSEPLKEPDIESVVLAAHYLRKASGLTREQVTTRIGVKPSPYVSFEQGKTDALAADEVARLPQVFDCRSLREMVDKAEALSLKEAGVITWKKAVSVATPYLRAAGGMSQDEVAAKIKVHASLLGRFEQGDIKALKPAQIEAIPGVFGCASWQEMQKKGQEEAAYADLRFSVALAARYLREAQGLTIETVAQVIDVHKSDLGSFERGDLNRLTKEQIARLPVALECHSLEGMVEKANAMSRAEPDDPEHRKAISRGLPLLRKAHQMMTEVVANKIGATRQAVSAFENGNLHDLSIEKIEKLPAVFGCSSPEEMIEKANALSQDAIEDPEGRRAVALALHSLRKARNMPLQEIADRIKVHQSNILRFEEGDIKTIGKEKIALLPGVFGCASMKHMLERANELTLEQIYAHDTRSFVDALKIQSALEKAMGKPPRGK